MSDAEEKKSDAAEKMKWKIEERDQARRENEKDEWEDVNQNLQTGTHDATHPGINWGPSYKIRRKRSKGSETQKKGEE